MEESLTAGEFETKHFVDVGAARVCYRKAGEGPALVLVHGFPLSGLTWRGLAPELSKRFTCYAFDLVGLGDSTSSDAADYRSDGQGAVLQRALHAAGVGSYALIGNDTGGWVARELAVLEPERVAHLILTNTEMPGHRPPWIPLYQRIARLPGRSLVFRTLLASRRFLRSAAGFGGCFEDRDLIDGEFGRLFVRPLIDEPERLDQALTFLVRMTFGKIDRFAELHSQLTMPVTFLWSAADPTFPEATARAMAAQFPNVAGFMPVPKGKLFFYEEYPEMVAELVMNVLAGASVER